MIYLASPYSSPNLDVEEVRFMDTCIEVAKLIEKGYIVFSPIVLFHSIAKIGSLNGSFQTWKKINYRFLSLCDELWIFCLEGWKESKGIQQEIHWAKGLQLPIVYLKE